MTDSAPSTKKAVLEWIDYILERKNWTGTDLARQSNLAPSTILRLMNDPNHKFVPTLSTLQKIAEGSGYSIPANIVDALGTGVVERQPGAERAPRSFHRVAEMAREQLDRIPITYISALPASLQSREHQEELVPRLPQLADDKTAVAFCAPDGSLDPAVPAGSLLYGTKRRDPKSGDIIVLVKKDGRALVRFLLEMSSDGLTMSKAMPMQKEQVINFDDIESIAAVVAVVRS